MIIKKHLLSAFYILISLTLSAQLNEIKEILKTKPGSEETAIWLCDTAFTFHRNNPELAQKIAELGLKEAKKIDSDLAASKANHVLGMSLWVKGDYDESIEAYLRALAYYEKLGNTRGIALINMNVGIVYSDLGQEERGISYYLKSEEAFKQIGDSVNLGNLYNNIATSFKHLGEDELTHKYYESSLNLRLGIKDSTGVAGVYNNMAVFYLEKDSLLTFENSRIASNYLNNALDFLRKDKDIRLFSLTSLNIGKCFIGLSRYAEADKYLDQSLEIAIDKEYKVIEKWVYEYKSLMYRKRGDYEKAYDFYLKEVTLDNELRNKEVNEKIEELNIQYQTAKKERKVAELESQNERERGIRNMLIIGAVSTFLIAALLVFYLIQKRKRDKLIAELKFQKMSDEVTAKNKEIASYTMSFLQKNQLMDELKEQINELKKVSDVSTNKELTRINKIVDNTFKSDEEWKTFQVTFDQMHDGFFKDLKQAFPDISNAELKLCALLRLNMNLKESAKILGIAVDSVKTARYRLRKKLGLKTEENLVDFLIQFENRMAS